MDLRVLLDGMGGRGGERRGYRRRGDARGKDAGVTNGGVRKNVVNVGKGFIE